MTARGTLLTQLIAPLMEVAIQTSVARRMLHAVLVGVVAQMLLAGMTLMDQSLTASGTLISHLIAPILEVAFQTSVSRQIVHAVRVAVVASMLLAGMTLMDPSLTASGTLLTQLIAPLLEVTIQTLVTQQIMHAVLAKVSRKKRR